MFKNNKIMMKNANNKEKELNNISNKEKNKENNNA
jgi:hypothetical protein